MISNQIIQNTLNGLKNITKADVCVYNAAGKLVATTFDNPAKFNGTVGDFMISPVDAQSAGGYHYSKIYDDGRATYVMIMEDTADAMVEKLANFQVQNILIAYQERFDRDNFVKNLLLDNLLLVDIYNRAKKLNIETSAKRCVYIVEANADTKVNVTEAVENLFPNKSKDFVTAVDEKDTILIKDIGEDWTADDLENYASMIITELKAGGVEELRVAYGTVVSEIKEVSKTYKEAKMSLEVGKIFYEERDIVGYTRLGIGRLIYQLPLPLCKMFLKETFDGHNPDELDEETLSTVDKFFENSLNVSETSRQLFIHRNTLVYRIDKLQKATGLDLRVFDDAITFKIAMMVGKYMNYMETQEF